MSTVDEEFEDLISHFLTEEDEVEFRKEGKRVIKEIEKVIYPHKKKKETNPIRLLTLSSILSVIQPN